jgi:hypothetical protein
MTNVIHDTHQVTACWMLRHAVWQFTDVSEVPAASITALMMAISCDVTPCSAANTDRRFRKAPLKRPSVYGATSRRQSPSYSSP